MIEHQPSPEHQNGPKPSTSMMEVIKNRNFLLLWIAQMLSQTAQQIINIALIVQIADITQSSTAVSGIIISFTIPAILFAAIAGVFVERNPKKTVLVVTNIARGIMVLAYVLTDANWGVSTVLIVFYVVTFLFSAVSQFFNPAELAMIPLLVRRNQLVLANSLFNLSFTATQLVGFAILGPLLLATVFHNNYAGLYFVLFVLYLICAGLTYFLPQDSPEETAAARRQRGEKVGVPEIAAGSTQLARSGFTAAREELLDGWRFVRQDSVIVSAIVYWSIAITVFFMLGAIGPNFLKVVLQIDPNNLYTILMPGGLGLLIGVLVVGRVATEANRQSMINWALFLLGAALLLFALVVPLTDFLIEGVSEQTLRTMRVVLLGSMAFLLGFLNSFIGVPAQTAMQERSPDKMRARVFSVFFTAQNMILILPVFFAGALADSLGYVQTVVVISLVVIGIAGMGLYRNYKQKEAATPAYHEERVTPEEAETAITAAMPGTRPPSSMIPPDDSARRG